MPVIGTQQSPIQIVHTSTIHAKIDPPIFGYRGALPGIFKGDNFVFHVKYKTNSNTEEDPAGKLLTVGPDQWVIRKIHIHAPAEHVVDDATASFECHLVHSRLNDVKARGPKLVVGVFFRIVSRQPKKARSRLTMFALNSLVARTGAEQGKHACPIEHPHDIDVTDFLPDRDSEKCYRYEGSLTSEPFSEDVSWYVLKHHSEVFVDNVDQILSLADQEARPVHALDRRFVLRNFA